MPFIQRLVQPTFLSRRCSSGGATATQYPFTASSLSSTTNQSSSKPLTSVKDASATTSTHFNGISSLAVGAIVSTSTSGAVIESSCTNTEGNDVITCGEFSGAAIAGNGGSAVNGKSGFMDTTTTATTSATTMIIPDCNSSEFETMTNITLSNALRQMASILIIANEIFLELNGELQNIANRSQGLKEKINILEKKVDKYDPKVVNVPVSDLATFAQIKVHYKHKETFDNELFTRDTRSRSVQALYEAAGKTPINLIKHEKGTLDNIDNIELLCTPVLGQTTRKMKTKIDADIEIRLPAAIEDLRKWTSTEAIGDITVTPDCINKVGCITTIINDTTIHAEIGSHISGISSAITDVIDSSSAFTTRQDQQPISASTVVEGDHYPLDHRLPSPEEQCKTIALKFPAEVVVVDVSGYRFDRLATARKSMISPNTAMTTNSTKCDESGLNSINNQTITRRQRSRRSRSKRRNTIAGTDQKEIEEAINGEMPSENLPENENTTMTTKSSTIKVERSRSSDILKNDSVINSTTTAIDIGKATLTKFNSLKEWGRNRLRLIGRNDDTNKTKSLEISSDQFICETVTTNNCKDKKKISEKDKRSLHERKPSYSSSEKGTPILEPINSVKLRDTSSLKRQRSRSMMKKEDIHSSSGNWSASSESGRTSIASEITVQPKSSASSSSLNHCHHQFHPSGSTGPMGSVPSRRRFLNTSASSSAASDGTATPDLQMCDPFYDDETSSAYSCDTEGYYTSFHVDSGLKTLKEEEPVTPLQSCSALSSSNSFETSTNQTILTAENEYEIFGRGSTSTTTSSAGTVCTTLLATDNEIINYNQQVPVVPERKSSLTKLNRSSSNTSASNSTLERSISSSTVGSTLERSGTIKRNGVFVQKEVSAVVHQEDSSQKCSPRKQTDSSDNIENMAQNGASQQYQRNQNDLEFSECSDIEGFDRVERIRQKTEINTGRIPSICLITPTTSDDETTKENIKSSINNQDEPAGGAVYTETHFDTVHNNNQQIDSMLKKTKDKTQIININKDTGYATIQTVNDDDSIQSDVRGGEINDEEGGIQIKDVNFNHCKRSRLQPLNNMLGKLKGVLPTLKKSPSESEPTNENYVLEVDEPIYDTAGEYVRISDVSNNNKPFKSINWTKRNLDAVLSGKLDEETEYVSLNELPCSIRSESNNLLPMHVNVSKESETSGEKIDNNSIRAGGMITKDDKDNINATHTPYISNNTNNNNNNNNKNTAPINTQNSIEGELSKGARVFFDAQGKIIYNSDSLKRRKGAHTTFAPGPFVRDSTTTTTITTNSPSSKVMIPSSYTIFDGSKSFLKNSASFVDDHNSEISSNLHGNFKKFPSSIKNVEEKEISGEKQLGQKSRINLFTTTTTTTKNSNNNNHSNNNIYNKREQQNMGQLGNESENVLLSNTIFDQKEEDFQHLLRRPSVDESSMLASLNNKLTLTSTPTQQSYQSPFGRDNRLYWTLQNKKRQSQRHINLSSDDYAFNNSSNPDISNIISDRESLKTTPQGFQTYFSPIAKRNTLSLSSSSVSNNFKTSTPLKDSYGNFSSSSNINDIDMNGRNFSMTPPPRTSISRKFASSSRDNNDIGPSSKTCSDRLGTSKTSLMDFKKLLLAKSSKNTVHKKLSAVEMLKLNKGEPQKCTTPPPQMISSSLSQGISHGSTGSILNSSMNILELSNSPKTYAKRRNFRHDNNLGSPSKSFGKQRTGWRINSTRTDVISTAIPEANSEEDSSGSDNTIGRPILTSTPQQQQQQQQQQKHQQQQNVPEKTIINDKVDLKKNIFLQAEENNFMKGEILRKNLKTIIQSNNNSNTVINNDEQKPQIEQQQQQHQQQILIRGSNIVGGGEEGGINETSANIDNNKIITKINKDPFALETAL